MILERWVRIERNILLVSSSSHMQHLTVRFRACQHELLLQSVLLKLWNLLIFCRLIGFLPNAYSHFRHKFVNHILAVAITLFRHRVMLAASFWKLFYLIKPNLMPHKNKQKRGCTPNGDISVSPHLSMALWWFAGGEAIDSHNARNPWSWGWTSDTMLKFTINQPVSPASNPISCRLNHPSGHG